MFITLALGLLAGSLVLLLARILERGPGGRFKRARYEAGNPPSGEAKARLPFQYYGYVLLYLSVEPLMVLFFLTTYYDKPALSAALAALALLPAVVWGALAADELERWRL
ncbi:MAG: NADH-quinone oxidoreductase subunit A [Thermofilum sp.]